MSYEIEKGVKMPRTGRKKYPFAKMKKGDSFVVEDRLRASCYNSARSFGSGKFGVYRCEDGKIRCFRIE